MGDVVSIGEKPEVKFPDAEPRKLVPVTITGRLHNGKTITDKMELALPQSLNDYVPAAAFVWSQYQKAGTISFREPGTDRFEFYPLSAFEKLEVEFSSVVGVTL